METCGNRRFSAASVFPFSQPERFRFFCFPPVFSFLPLSELAKTGAGRPRPPGSCIGYYVTFCSSGRAPPKAFVRSTVVTDGHLCWGRFQKSGRCFGAGPYSESLVHFIKNGKAVQEQVDLSGVAQNVSLPFEGVAYEKGHVLNSEIQPHVAVDGNAQQLSSLISILLENAVQYSTEGADIHFSLSEENHRAVLRVRNKSPEMSPEQCGQLFERFYRSDASRPGDGHYGLGLSIAQKIVQTHHGQISASWKDGSITFTTLLPLSKA